MGGKRSREGFGAPGTEPLIKLKVGPWQQEVEFLICLKPITWCLIGLQKARVLCLVICCLPITSCIKLVSWHSLLANCYLNVTVLSSGSSVVILNVLICGTESSSSRTPKKKKKKKTKRMPVNNCHPYLSSLDYSEIFWTILYGQEDASVQGYRFLCSGNVLHSFLEDIVNVLRYSEL